MPTKDHQPKVGDQIFISTFDNAPILISVTGFHYHTHLKKDVMDYECLNGKKDWSDPDKLTFYPEIPVDTRYLYVLVSREDRENTWGHEVEEAFFFNPKDAFELRRAIASGEKKAKNRDTTALYDFFVEVQEVT